MKKNKLASLVLSAIMTGSLIFGATDAEAAIQVNPIDGIRSDFIKGADVSMLKEIELKNGKFYDQGVEKDCLDILQQHGINWVRLRIWNNPIVNGIEVGGGNTDEAKALELAARAKARGMKVLLDFHYSDFWADPGKQNKPAAWANHNAKQLQKDVYDYTSKVMKDFTAKGIAPDMVQIGNELNNGMLWPEGKPVSPEGYKNLAGMIGQGLKAVHDNDPNHQVKLMVHLANGGDNALYRSFFDSLIVTNKVNDFDVIGLSYYPFWHGKMEQLENNMNDISGRYNKDVVVVETAFGFTNDGFDTQKNVYGPTEERIGGYKSSVQGQATGLRNVMEAVSKVNNKRGMGIFYWEPDWIPTPGVGWKYGEGNEWENLAMFDFKGNALESLDVFNLVSAKDNKFVQAAIKALEPVDVIGNIGKPTELPQTISAVYTDDSSKDLPVVWDVAAPVYDTVGNYRVSGSVTGSEIKAIAKVTVINKVNLVKNGNFETGDLNQWTVKGDMSAVNNSNSAGDVRDKSAMHYWADKAFSFTATQTITGLKNGKYTLSVWTQGGGGEKTVQLFAEQFGGAKVTTPITNDGWNKWHQWTIKDINVTNGQITIGVDNQANAGNWGSVDDVELYVQE
ncbi:glycosyl hydrolase 53 family protein [Propionispira raffinosivorans]|uniref:glycosyl hydrolase 53 family protein n=1 Tax=Propionispira raffinosivorans TaxID=86959 RepID=UPI0003808AF6|nr:glycosyl hydrolase 53 family protein [Propionispira raffinosivorans]